MRRALRSYGWYLVVAIFVMLWVAAQLWDWLPWGNLLLLAALSALMARVLQTALAAEPRPAAPALGPIALNPLLTTRADTMVVARKPQSRDGQSAVQRRSDLLREPAPIAALQGLAAYRWLVVGTVCIGAFLGQLDASIATLVLPTLEQAFRATTAEVEWVAIAYLLTLAALVVPFGRLADMAGRKLLYTGGFVVFIGGSALCGLAPSLAWLIGFRALQALGAAMLQSNSVAIITAAVPRRRLGRAIGVQGAAQAIGLSIGPSVGGLLISALDWHWVFYIAVPFGLAGTVVAWFVLPRTEHRDAGASAQATERFDWRGALVFATAVALALVALTFGNSWGWTSVRLVAVGLAAAGALALFAVIERRTACPLVDLSLFRNRVFTASIVSGLLSYGVLFGALFVLPFFVQRTLLRDAATTGGLLTVIPVALAVLAPVSGLLADRHGPRLPTMSGMALTTGSLLVLTFTLTGSIGLLVTTFAVLGIGIGLFTPANNSAIMGSAPEHRLGVAGGVLNMTRSLGTSLGVAGAGTVLALATSAAVGHAVASTLSLSPTALAAGFRDALLFLAVLAGLASILSGLRGRRDVRPVAAEAQAIADASGA